MERIWSGGLSDQDGPDLSGLLTDEDTAVDAFLLNSEILGLIAYHLELSNSSVISKAESAEILKSLLKHYGAHPGIPKGFEDVHTYVEALVKKDTEAGKNLRIFLSRNDQSHHDIRSFYLDSILAISEELVGISDTISAKLTPLNGQMAGYTHYRQAMPVSFSTYFDHLAAVFLDLSGLALDLYRRLASFSPLGYGSGYGTALPVDMSLPAAKLGYESNFKNPVHGSFYRGVDDTDMAYLETRILSAISRMAQDLILFSSDEFGFLRLPAGFVTGSSLMPNKRNPDFLEMLQGFASEALGNLTMAVSASMNKETGYHREFQLIKDKVVVFTDRTVKVLKAVNSLLQGVTVDADLASSLMKNSVNATSEAYELFKSGIKWKDAYQEIGRAVREGKTLGPHTPKDFIYVTEEMISKAGNGIQKLRNKRESVATELLKEAASFIETTK